MIVPDKDKGIIRFIFSEANFCLGSNPFPEKKDEKIFFSSGMMMVRSIVRGDCPCIFQPLSSETVVSSVSPLLLRYTPQCYGARQGRRGIVQACCIADILIDRKEIKKRGYIETMYPLFSERKTRLKLATLSLEG